jgi:transcriptional regulator with PAS, ATPase and Fis domain
MNNKRALLDGLYMSKTGPMEKLSARDSLVKDYLGDVLLRFKAELTENDFVILINNKREIILDSFFFETKNSLSGYKLTEDAKLLISNSLRTITFNDDYCMSYSFSEASSVNPMTIVSEVENLLKIYDKHTANMSYIIDSLDYMENPIGIYDSDMNFVYGNDSYCGLMHISDRVAALGVNAKEIFELLGITFKNKGINRNHWIMYDVIREKKKFVDIELQIEANKFSKEPAIVSHSIYPIIEQNDGVSGVIELITKNRINLSNVNKLINPPAEYTFDSIIYSDSNMEELIAETKVFAASKHNVLITGESGVGKELFAQSIHNYSNRSSGPFIAISCANFPENLIESELFGYVGGAFTGASKNGQLGKVELASGGTLFLDEIGELPFYFQPKLLRMLETGKIMRIGDSKEINVDVRIIAATNCNLEEMVRQGLFRKDLYYRLQVLEIEIPPLRERSGDIIGIAEKFLHNEADYNDNAIKVLDQSAKEHLVKYQWPGNVRELRNVISRVHLLTAGKIITGEDIDAAIDSKSRKLNTDSDVEIKQGMHYYEGEVETAKKNLLQNALEMADGDKTLAAKSLGVSRATFYRMLKKYGLDD